MTEAKKYYSHSVFVAKRCTPIGLIVNGEYALCYAAYLTIRVEENLHVYIFISKCRQRTLDMISIAIGSDDPVATLDESGRVEIAVSSEMNDVHFDKTMIEEFGLQEYHDMNARGSRYNVKREVRYAENTEFCWIVG